jgi:hypothetical protein
VLLGPAGIAPWPILEHCWQDEIWNVTGGETRFGKQLTDEATFCPAHAHARTRTRTRTHAHTHSLCGCLRAAAHGDEPYPMHDPAGAAQGTLRL